VEAERLHKSIVQPLLSPTSHHYRALQRTHEALLRTVKDITGKDAPFIQWNGTGPVQAKWRLATSVLVELSLICL
jgi:hypothetical protein